MSTSTLRTALLLSVLFNLGMLASLGWQRYTALPPSSAEDPLLVRELQLSDSQRQQWEAIEAPFMHQLNESAARIQHQRNRLIDTLFDPSLNPQLISDEQERLAALQNAQQQLVIDQLLRERDILDEQQRQHLAQLLIEQAGVASDVEVLHTE